MFVCCGPRIWWVSFGFRVSANSFSTVSAYVLRGFGAHLVLAVARCHCFRGNVACRATHLVRPPGRWRARARWWFRVARGLRRTYSRVIGGGRAGGSARAHEVVTGVGAGGARGPRSRVSHTVHARRSACCDGPRPCDRCHERHEECDFAEKFALRSTDPPVKRKSVGSPRTPILLHTEVDHRVPLLARRTSLGCTRDAPGPLSRGGEVR